MSKVDHAGGRRWVRVVAVFGLAAACSGRVERSRDDFELTTPGSGATAGTASAVGGVSGVGSGGVGAGGNGGAYASGGTYGYGGWGCFVAGTKISTPSGTTAIEALEIGDLVLAYDERAARVVVRPVTATFVHQDHPIGVLTTSDGRNLGVTANHPIYVPDEGRYADAGELRGDERLLGLHPGARITSTIAAGYAIAPGALETVYNITVAGEHNYFAEGVLVHNKSGSGPVPECRPVSWSGWCDWGGCLDPNAPTPERVRLNQPALTAHDAGASDAGGELGDSGTDAGPDGGELGGYAVEIGICGAFPPSSPYLAFDVWSVEPEPVVGLYTSDVSCGGWQLGEIWLTGESPPAPNTWTTQCVRLPLQWQSKLSIVPATGNTYVGYPRFVSDCECPRTLMHRNTCRVEGPSDGGGCE
jgi:hypothetical protein